MSSSSISARRRRPSSPRSQWPFSRLDLLAPSCGDSRLEESPGAEQSPLRLRHSRLEETRIARLSAVPGVGSAHAETADDRNSARRAEKLQGVVVGCSLSGSQPGDAVSQTGHLPTRAEQARARSDASSGTVVE